MTTTVISVPYDSGVKNARMGAGPTRLLELGIGAEGNVTHIDLPEDFFAAEVQSAIELDRRIASAVMTTRENNEFPLILSGNCNSSIGTISGLGIRRIGIVWFDAHGDFNTPETTRSGFFYGMALGVITVRCSQRVSESIPGFRTVPDNRIALVGARSFDPGESAALGNSEVTVVPVDEISNLRAMIDTLDADEIYLHVDLDVLDSTEAKANTYAITGGLTSSQLADAIRVLGKRFRICAAAITAYDPSADTDGAAGRIAVEISKTILSAVQNPT